MVQIPSNFCTWNYSWVWDWSCSKPEAGHGQCLHADRSSPVERDETDMIRWYLKIRIKETDIFSASLGQALSCFRFGAVLYVSHNRRNFGNVTEPPKISKEIELKAWPTTMFEIYHHVCAGTAKGKPAEHLWKHAESASVSNHTWCADASFWSYSERSMTLLAQVWSYLNDHDGKFMAGGLGSRSLGCLWVWIAILWTCSLLPSNMSLPFGTYIGRLSHWTTCRPAIGRLCMKKHKISRSLSRALEMKAKLLGWFLVGKRPHLQQSIANSLPSCKNCRHLGPSHPVTHRVQNPASFPSFPSSGNIWKLTVPTTVARKTMSSPVREIQSPALTNSQQNAKMTTCVNPEGSISGFKRVEPWANGCVKCRTTPLILGTGCYVTTLHHARTLQRMVMKAAFLGTKSSRTWAADMLQTISRPTQPYTLKRDCLRCSKCSENARAICSA